MISEYQQTERPAKYLHGKELTAWVIERTCLRKANLTKEEADRAVDRHAAQKNLIYYYRCEFCGSYHLTHKETVGPRKIEVI